MNDMTLRQYQRHREEVHIGLEQEEATRISGSFVVSRAAVARRRPS